jgi:diguanylate cyclase (GGDEF)-like protein
LHASDWHADALLVLLASGAAVPYFFLTSFLVRLVLHFKNKERLTVAGLVHQFGWIAATYALSALVAVLLYITARHAGPGVLFAALPVIALLLTTMHFHYRQREAEDAAVQARVEAAEREAEITARHNIELKRIADHDALTALVNRRHFVECLNEVFENRARSGSEFAVLFMDFDHFKQINDTLGHAGGDEFLVHVANRILRRVRVCDVVARLGGDEFAVLMTDVEDEGQVTDTAERVLETLRLPYDVSGSAVTTSVSIGITFSKYAYASAGDMLRDADRAMYYAKSLGGARYTVHRPAKAPRAVDPDSRQHAHA